MTSKKIARVDRKVCVSCGACTHVCPRGAISIWKGCWSVVDGTLCIGCGLCARSCPADCISLVMREEQA